ncbi:phosphoglucomutase [Paenibacillus selenitireducens]|uniref:Phosphoglucomutase n=1 Tax=Paenibacillus selenitireducens TaxID=1324314 RepID=A0A1T2X731_9BACL|nr:phospho-sugar mutase [Paenibacillus selenitireducens]OPA75687.1 phosphoglucomutase [Paenibacillus selenitireducens]
MTQEKRSAQEIYESWLQDHLIDEATKQELKSIADQPREIEERFYKELEFGTGGLRGIMGAGTNRMNKYTIGRATQGFAQFILKQHEGQPGKPSVVIAYDSRNNSPEFALESALVLAGNGIVAKVYKALRPTPQLSYSVRALQATGGIVITASHNPPEYNGYKVYNSEGCQVVPHEAEQVIADIQNIASFSQIRTVSREEAESQGLLVWLGEEEDQAYIQTVAAESKNKALIAQEGGLGDNFRIVYTPLHGSGNMPVRRVLEEIGFKHVYVVPEQEQPDGNFSTVKSPNPEEREAFTLAVKLAEEVDADIIIGTDPDADRMGAVVKNSEGEYVVLSGNQSGAIMVYYVLSQMKAAGQLPSNGAVVKTIVTSEMGATIARHFGATVMNTLTGFKYIGEKMTQFAATGDYTYLFGYEESYGYLAGTYARDKDAIIASMLISEAAAYYKSQGKTLYDVLHDLYESFGYFMEKLESRTLKGIDGVAQIQAIMTTWREQAPAEVAGVKITECIDYSAGVDGLPPENVLKFMLEDGSWFCLRPSGTEPKIKIYFAVRGQSYQESTEALDRLVAAVVERL